MVGKKFLGAAVAAVGLGLSSFAGQLQAASISDTIVANAGFNNFGLLNLKDDDRTWTTDNAANGTIDIGDTLRGQFVVRSIDVGATNISIGGATSVSELTGIYQVVVTGKSGTPGSGFNYTFGAVTGGVNLLGTGAVFAFYEDAANNANLAQAPFGASLTDGALWGIIGFSGAGGVPNNTGPVYEQFIFSSTSVAGSHSDASSAANIGSFTGLGLGDFRLTLLDTPANALTDPANSTYKFAKTLNGVDLEGTFRLFGGQIGNTSVADFTSTAEFRSTSAIAPLPSAAWAGMALLGALGATRLRRKK